MPNRLSSERDRLSAMASCSCSGISSFGQSIIRPRGMKGEVTTRRRSANEKEEEGEGERGGKAKRRSAKEEKRR